ncbi:DUF4301 family protein [Olleya aquimaris]|uniref:Uncharacterized protein DUF4301 n=1 Tax=Olleya aquimaris TaxID=639310 RepID=A0A327RDC5_9FLAO|nr:DUF4301 family protein [Olleya aquimaris]RAJ14960.1 uncharacterized protein DUF4301 [Olleya aquimaris]
MKFSKTDIEFIKKKGLTLKKVEQQLELLKNGLPYINLERAATINDGIVQLSYKTASEFIDIYETKKETLDIIKFVPASGAATRMFKFLFDFLKDYNPNKESINAYINKHKASELSLFFIGIEKLPFYDLVINYLKETNSNYNQLKNDEKLVAFVKAILDQNQLDFSSFPKGLLPFHKYKDHLASAFEEHLFEAALYAATNNEATLHFTISEKHKDKFDEEFTRIQNIVEQKTKTTFHISFSYQKEATDTIAVTTKDEVVREDNQQLYFRPSGHGALLENLNDFDADIIFIKNIDNVVVYKYEEEVAQSKKLLAGLLITIKEQAYKYAKDLDEKELTNTQIHDIAKFLITKMNVVISPEFEKYSKQYQIDYLKNKLDRPIRVCGMVQNEGEPGGGPFWVKDEGANVSLQIVESAQVDKKSKIQKSILKHATHFNPVDIVCSIKNYKGETYDLQKFVDHQTAFITMKTKVNKDIKALELPGLWNGSMANWNTIFVEVPLVTFNPVKTVNDLLKPTHQVS